MWPDRGAQGPVVLLRMGDVLSTSRPLSPSTVFLSAVLPILAAIGLTVGLGRTAPADAPQTEAIAAGAVQSGSAALMISTELEQWSGLVRAGASDKGVAGLLRHPGRASENRPGVEAFLKTLNDRVSDGAGEASVIDTSGALVAQVVAGRVTPTGLLGTDQRSRPFHAAATRTAAGAVHQHRPYVSPHTRTWVISTSAPVVVAGKVLGMLQVESGVDLLREALVRSVPAGTLARVVDTSSYVTVADTRRAVPRPAPERALDMQWLPRADRLDTGRDQQVYASAVQVPAALGAWRAEVLGGPATAAPGPVARLWTWLGASWFGSSWYGLGLLVAVLATAGALRHVRIDEQMSETARPATDSANESATEPGYGSAVGSAVGTSGRTTGGPSATSDGDPSESGESSEGYQGESGSEQAAVSAVGVPVVPAPRSGSGRRGSGRGGSGRRVGAGTPGRRERDRG